MTDIDPFGALGYGNGFAECVQSVDVSGYDRWITASGHKKGDGTPSPTSIQESFDKVYRFYWMLESVTFSGLEMTLYTFDGCDEFGGIGPPVELSVDFNDPISLGLPHEVVCSRVIINETRSEEADGCPGADTWDSNIGIIVEAGRGFVYKLYDGPTDEEDNFMGWAAGGFEIASGGISYNGNTSAVLVYFRSGLFPSVHSNGEHTCDILIQLLGRNRRHSLLGRAT